MLQLWAFLFIYFFKFKHLVSFIGMVCHYVQKFSEIHIFCKNLFTFMYSHFGRYSYPKWKKNVYMHMYNLQKLLTFLTKEHPSISLVLEDEVLKKYLFSLCTSAWPTTYIYTCIHRIACSLLAEEQPENRGVRNNNGRSFDMEQFSIMHCKTWHLGRSIILEFQTSCFLLQDSALVRQWVQKHLKAFKR